RESREFRRQSQRKIRARDHRRRKSRESLPQRVPTRLRRDTSERRTSAWHLAVGRRLARIWRVRERRTLRWYWYRNIQDPREDPDRTNNAGVSVCSKCSAERCRDRKSDATRHCREYSAFAHGSSWNRLAGSSSLSGGKLPRPVRSCSDCREGTCAKRSISSVS